MVPLTGQALTDQHERAERLALRAGRPPERRLLSIAALISLGILAGHALSRTDLLSPSAAALFAGAGAAVLAALVAPRGRWSLLCLCLALIALGAAWHRHRAIESPSDHLFLRLTESPTLLTVEGLVLERPEVSTRPPGRLARFVPRDQLTAFRLRANSIIDAERGPLPARGTLDVRVQGDASALRAGDRVRLTGMGVGVAPPTNPGQRDPRPAARAQGLAGRLSVSTPDLVTPAEQSPSALARLGTLRLRALSSLRARAGDWLDAPAELDGPDHSGALLRALLLGQRDDRLSDVRAAFARLGLNHLLAISGLHLVLLAGSVLWAVRTITMRPALTALGVALAVVLVLLIVPAKAPIVRAALMVLAFLVAEACGRRYDAMAVLAGVFLCVLAWDPTQLFDIGAQLSFGVVAALVTIAPRLHTRLFGPPPLRDLMRPRDHATEWIKRLFSASLCAWGVSAAWVAWSLGVFAPLGVLATMLLLPVTSLLLGVAYLALLLTLIVPPLGAFAEPALRAGADALLTAAFTLDTLPNSALHLPALSAAWAVLTTGIVVWWMIGADPRRPLAIIAALVPLLWLGAQLWTASRLPRDQALRLDSLDVADGSCHLLRIGYEALLYDCGSLRLTVGERTIPAAVRAVGAWRVPTVVLSHPDLDHFAGVLDIVRPLGVRTVLVGEAFQRAADTAPGGPVAFVLSELRSLGVEVRTLARGDSFTLAGADIRVLSPARGERQRFDNDASLVLLVSVPTDAGEHRLLFTGDIQRYAIATMMEEQPDLRADILEAPHHGSHIPIADHFITAIDPAIVIQSTGPRRLGDTRWALQRAARRWLSTAERGAITTVIDRSGSVRDHDWRPPGSLREQPGP